MDATTRKNVIETLKQIATDPKVSEETRAGAARHARNQERMMARSTPSESAPPTDATSFSGEPTQD